MGENKKYFMDIYTQKISSSGCLLPPEWSLSCCLKICSCFGIQIAERPPFSTCISTKYHADQVGILDPQVPKRKKLKSV